MAFALLVLISALSISSVAAYFSIIGLATMFPGSTGAVITMGAVLEIGKLVAAVWLHKNWKSCPGLLKLYLVPAVLVLTGITSMGIFGFLSKSHIEHQALSDQESAQIAQIDEKIERKKEILSRKEADLVSLKESTSSKKDDNLIVIEEYRKRISDLNDELKVEIEIEQERISQANLKLSELDQAIEKIREKGGFSVSSNIKKAESAQKKERESLAIIISEANKRIIDFRDSYNEKIELVRQKIDQLQQSRLEDKPAVISSDKIEVLQSEIESIYDEVDALALQKFDFGQKLRSLEAEVGPIKYISLLVKDFGGGDFALDKAVRTVILILIFVFDPLAILLLISATISFGHAVKKKLPADVLKIRGKLLDELEDYMGEGGTAEQFLDRARN